ncbi:MAG: AEC family transporter [Clostridia bacterium]|nr:AEC family transporter [Clostridia bacterium]
MESLQLSFNSVLPIFILMAFGYLLRLFKVAEKSHFDAANKLVFRIFLPVMLFYNIYKTESLKIFDLKLISFTIIGILSIYILGYFVVLGVTRDNSKRGVMLQGFFRSNYAILGIPLVNYICGENTIGLASLMVAIVVPTFNVLAVICLEGFRKGKVNIFSLIKGIITNPLIIGCILGAVCLVSKVKLPYLIENAVVDVSKIATPLSIIALGASFIFTSLKGRVCELLITVFTKLIFSPLIMLTIAVFLGFKGEALACILITFGSPIAISSFAMSQEMGGDEKLSAQSIVLSSALCILTLFGWIFVLSRLGLF